MTRTDDEQRYKTALDGLHRFAAHEIAEHPAEAGAEPCCLRSAYQSGLISNDAAVTLLIEKGIFTEDEYIAGLAYSAEKEVARMLDIVARRNAK